MTIQNDTIKTLIQSGETYLGIELGSTRIKAVLIDKTHTPIASGSHKWENKLEDNIWTYSLDDIWQGLRGCYSDLCSDVSNRYGVMLTTVGAMGFSAMMHGYMAFDESNALLVPFRTWRNTMTGQACEKLTELFSFNIPQRWSISHLYQVILNGEKHLDKLSYMTTLAGYIHWMMTGEKVIGIGDASGMFPIDSQNKQFNKEMLNKFDDLIASKGYSWRINDIMPKVLTAGQSAGILTAEGAKLLDPSGALQAGIPLCPPEGDAGTGMVATNSVKRRTGNVSAGTSVFAMAVLEKPLSSVYPEIDIVTTPSGDDVAMVHCNNCTGDLDAWIGLFKETLEAFGANADADKLYSTLYNKALEGDADCGGLLAYNYLSGEHVTGFDKGRPLFVRTADSSFNLANFMRVHLYTSLGALKTGMDIVKKREGVQTDALFGHGGFFKVDGVGQRVMAAAMGTVVNVMENAGEGGPWGIAILAAFMKNKNHNELLESYLSEKVFAQSKVRAISPSQCDVDGYEKFMERYSKGLAIETSAVKCL